MKEKRTAYCNTDQSVFSYGYEHIINCFKRKGSWHGVKGKVVNSSPFILAGWMGGGSIRERLQYNTPTFLA